MSDVYCISESVPTSSCGTKNVALVRKAPWIRPLINRLAERFL